MSREKDIAEVGRGVSKEIEKCDLLCANCHREIHAELDKLAASQGNLRMNSE